MSTLLGTYANGLVVGPATVAEIEAAPTIAGLFAEYADESLVKGLPAPSAKWGVYRGLEAGGLLFPYAATLAGELVGFITVLVSLLPRYSQPLAVAESFFVAGAHRKTGAGVRLLRAAETKARELGAPGLLVSAPFGGRLFEVLPRLGYAETNRIFFRSFDDG
jgi:GNAT superfamily N-acetyltransferase